MRTTIRMNEELARQAKHRAAETGCTFTALVEEAVAAFIARPAEQASRRRRITFPVVGDPKNRITEEQYRAMINEMYEEEAIRAMRGMRKIRDSA